MAEMLKIAELKDKVGQTVTVRGWVNAVRDQKAVQFVILRDRSGMVQLVNKPEDNAELGRQISELTNESTIRVEGEVLANEIVKLSGIELKLTKLELLSKAGEVLPIDDKTALEGRMDWRYLDLRDPKKRLIFEVWTTMEAAGRKYWLDNGYIEIHSPKFMATPSEGSAELFEVEYFDRKAYLAQSPQFYKQMAMAAGFDRVFEVGPVFRANPSFTSRHDTEFTGYDMELSWIDSHEDVMAEEEKWLAAMIEAVTRKHGEAIEHDYGRTIVVPKLPFPRVTLAEAKKLLEPHKIATEQVDDLNPEEERKLSEIIAKRDGHEFVFVTEYPVSARAFYHMRKEDDPTLTKSFDLLWNGIEITTGAQREHRIEKLQEQAKEKGIKLDSLAHYLDFFRYGVPPHGGLGLSPSRLLMKLFDLASVREATYLYRGPNRLTP